MKRTVEDESVAKPTEEQKAPQAAPKPAVQELEPEDMWVPGKPAPKGVENPPPGKPGHRCIDLKGFYRPDWVSMKVTGENLPASLYISSDNGGWTVKTGVYVDVPPEIPERLLGCTYTETETEVINTSEGPRRVTRSTEVSRFSPSVLPSA